MNQDLTEIVFILDRSGSMEGLEKETIGGFNGFVKQQAKIGPTCLTTVLFDDKYEILHNGVDAGDVVLTDREYFTRGYT
ncbi:MAG: VWA domain-containing protein, partial [Treponema sp.]|nr:VWA domain-containing protein [Treponema sp.]